MKDKIISAALEVFDEMGFHRAGIRDIARLAQCSLPTLYYYFNNKEHLFEIAVCEAYEKLTTQIEEQLPDGMPAIDRYYFAVLQRQMLTPDEKRVYRIAIKIQLGVDGFEPVNSRLSKWENDRLTDERKRLEEESGDSAFASIVLRVVDNMLQRSILFGETLTGDQIRQELKYLLN